MKKLILGGISVFLFSASFSQSHSLITSLDVYEMNREFKRNTDHCLPVGVSVGYLYTAAESPFSFGAEIGFASYNQDEYTITFEGEEVAMIEDDCFMTVAGLMRYNFHENDYSRLYGEGRLGLTTFYSSSYSEDCIEGVDGGYTHHGTAFNLGFGGGLMINPATLLDRSNHNDLWIDFKITTNAGSNTQYGTLERLPVSGTSLESLTNYTAYKIGIVFGLN